MATKDLPDVDVRPVPEAELATLFCGNSFDAVVVVGPGPLSALTGLPTPLQQALALAEAADAALTNSRPLVAVVPTSAVAGGRLVISLTESTTVDETDVRAFATAAALGIARATAAGARHPLLVPAIPEGDPRFARAREVTLLGGLAALWRPFELRDLPGYDARVASIGIVGLDQETIARTVALENGRIVARDLCGTEPEVMAPPRFAAYCENVFAGTEVQVSVLADKDAIKREYPLLAAVSRACDNVPRHQARVIRLDYTGEGPITRTFLFAGKGVTYDTGGADLKTDGHMAGMSRDKGGAAAVAGLFRVLADTKPKGVRVIGLIGAVRNSIGSEAFVTDEIITGRAGVRVRIGNTDAEGRLVLADLLAHLREEAATQPDPLLASIATLTGHAVIAFGPYTAVVETSVARRRESALPLVRAAEAMGEGLERSRLRSEDYAMCAAKGPAEDVVSCNSLPSSRTPRGHQFPAAFLDIVSGLRAHNTKASEPIPFLHIDIAGSVVGAGGWAFGVPTGAPVLALAEGFDLL